MKKLILFAAILFAVSCQKDEQFKTTVKASPYNVAFSASTQLPYHISVQTETKNKNGQFVFSSLNDKKIYNTFADAVKDTSIVNVVIEKGELIEATKVKK